MFCPQCGQQQSTGEVRFCPRCGLSLVPHASLLAGDINAAAGPSRAQLSEQAAKRIGIRRGAKLMFISVVIAPVFLGLCFLIDGPVPLFVPFTLFLAGLAWMIYAWLFGDELINVNQYTPPQNLKAGGEKPALGAPQFIPAPLFNQQRTNTAEILQPPSVTENTTTLLDKDA